MLIPAEELRARPLMLDAGAAMVVAIRARHENGKRFTIIGHRRR